MPATRPGAAVPGMISPVRRLSPGEVADFRECFGRARYVHADGKARRRLPLSWRTRARLRLWRALGMVRD